MDAPYSTYTHIVVPLDGSAAAEKALPVAVLLSHCTGATLRLIRAVPRVRAAEHGLEVGLVRPSDHVASGAASYLQRVARRLRVEQLCVETTLWRGDAAEGILAAAQEDSSALVLLASRGRWLLGSVARRVLREAPVPVLLLRGDGRPLPPASPYALVPRTPLHVVVPLDGTPEAEAALEPALDLLAALAAPKRGRLHLVHVVPAFGGDWGLDESRARAYLQAVGDRVAARMPRERGYRVTWSVLFETEAAPAIVRFAEGGDGHGLPPSAIVMAAGGGRREALQRILGGVTEQVLRGTRLPVMVIGQRVKRAAPVLNAPQATHDTPALAAGGERVELPMPVLLSATVSAPARAPVRAR